MINEELERLLCGSGASLVGFARVEGLYDLTVFSDCAEPGRGLQSLTEYPRGVSIAAAIPKEVVAGIKDGPTADYYREYHSLNDRLDELAALCAGYIERAGFHAKAQTVSSVRQSAAHRTAMPHKTVAARAGLGWIGKCALLVTERFGSAIRLTSVLTDAPLECRSEMPEPKCGGCTVCADACPGMAVSGKLWRAGCDRDEIFDAAACRLKAREISRSALGEAITICGKCIEVCPYTQRYISRQ